MLLNYSFEYKLISFRKKIKFVYLTNNYE